MFEIDHCPSRLLRCIVRLRVKKRIVKYKHEEILLIGICIKAFSVIALYLARASSRLCFVRRVLSEQDAPLVPINDFLPIVDVFTNEERGELKLVFALGTSDQVVKECTEIISIQQHEKKTLCFV